MALAIVQTSGVGSGTLTVASPVLSAALTTTTGNLMVIGFRVGSGAAITSISDPGGNTWIPLQLVNTVVATQFFYAKNITGFVAGQITINFSPTPANNPFGMFWEISGADKQNPLDAQAFSSLSVAGGSTTVSTQTPMATNYANEIILAMLSTNGQNTPYVQPSGFTTDAVLPTSGVNVQLGHCSHLIASSKQNATLTYSWTVVSGTTGSSMVAVSFIAAGQRPAPGFVQGVGSTTAPSGLISSLAFTSNVTAGDLLVVGFRHTVTGNINSITDSLGVNGNWTVVYNTNDGTGTFGGWAYTFTKASGPCTVNINYAASDFAVMCLGEWNGVNTARSTPVAATGSSTTPTSGSATAVAGDLILGFSEITAGSTGFTPGGGYTLSAQGSVAGTFYQGLEHNLNAAGGATTASFTVSGVTAWTAGIGDFFTSVFAISGSCGVPFATINYSGPTSGTVFADGSGNFSIPNLGNGTYNVSPSAPGKIFSPASRSAVLVGANVSGLAFTGFTGGGDEGPGFDFTFRL